MSGPRIKIEMGESAIFTRVEVDGRELSGVTRVWFDSGDLNGADGPARAWRNHTRVHIELLPDQLVVEGTPDVDLIETRPIESPDDPPLVDGCRIVHRADGFDVCRVHHRYWKAGTVMCPGRRG